METQNYVQAFLSYAHDDAAVDSWLLPDLTDRLEKLVLQKVGKGNFKIEYDRGLLRTGDDWESKIIGIVQSSHLFLVPFSAIWVTSKYCQLERAAFQPKHQGLPDYGTGYCGLLLADTEIGDTDEAEVKASLAIKDRFQFIRAKNGQPLGRVTAPERDEALRRLADDIAKKVTAIRSAANSNEAKGRAETKSSTVPRPATPIDEFGTGDKQLVVHGDISSSAVLGNFDFSDRYSIEDASTRIDFCLRQAELTLDFPGAQLVASDALRANDCPHQVFRPNGALKGQLTVLLNPKDSGHLRGQVFEPTSGNWLAEIASIKGAFDVNVATARLAFRVSLEHLAVHDQPDVNPTAQTINHVETLLGILIAKNLSNDAAPHRVTYNVEIEDGRL
jgi:hypothetical protein